MQKHHVGGSAASVITAGTQLEPVIDFRNQSSAKTVTKFCGIIYDIAIKAEFTKAYHKAQQIITHEYVKRNLEDFPNSSSNNNNALNKKPTKRFSAISAVSSIDMESMDLFLDEPFQSVIQSMQIPAHLKRFLVEYLLYLPHTTNWSKFGRTRQLHISLLERWHGYISQKVMSAVDKEVYADAIENTRKKRKQNISQNSEPGQQGVDQGIPAIVEIGGTEDATVSSSSKPVVGVKGVGSVKSSSMSSTIQPFSSKQSVTPNSPGKVAIIFKAAAEKQLSPWNQNFTTER